jgi:hypothetical protein
MPVASLLFLLSDPSKLSALNSAYENAAKPGTVEVSKLKTSLSDFSEQVIHCYHKTASFDSVKSINSPYSDADSWGANRSAVIEINYRGKTGMKYKMSTALLVRNDEIRTLIISDTAIIPASKKCELNNWMKVTS